MLSTSPHHTEGRRDTTGSSADTAAGQWYAVWTHSHCEQLVHDQLLQRGLHTLLPTINNRTTRRGQQRVSRVPLFPGYVFIRHAMDKETHIQVLRARGVVRILGETWDRLTSIPNEDMDRIEQVVQSGELVRPHPYLAEGQRARMIAGPFAGLEGIVLRSKSDRSLLVMSVHLLRRSVSVSVDRADVEAV